MPTIWKGKRDQCTFEEISSTISLLSVGRGDGDCTKLLRAMHHHDDRLEILFIQSGNGIYIIDGIRYYVSKGDIIIFNCNVPHEEFSANEDELVVYSCAITNVYIKGLRPNYLTTNTQSPVIKNLSDYQRQEIENIFLMMYEHINKESIYSIEIVTYIAKTLLIIIRELIDQQKNIEIQKEKSEYSNNICNYIDRHFLEKISLEEISQVLNLNQYYIAHIFKKNMGLSTMQYVIKRRLGEAQSYLLQTDRSITDIAYIVGFSSGSYFQTMFKKYIGITPNEYRRIWKNSPDKKFINFDFFRL